MPDPRNTHREAPPPGGGNPTRRFGPSPGKPGEVGVYKEKDKRDSRPPPVRVKREVGDLETKSRLSPEAIASLGKPNNQQIEYMRKILASYPAPAKEDDNISGRVRTASGQPATKDLISGSIVFARNFLQSASFAGELGEERLEALLLYCGGELNRLFLLTNASILMLRGIDPNFYNQLNASRSIKLSAPGKRDIHIFLAPRGVEKTLMDLCRKHPATDSVLTHVEELRLSAADDSSPSGADLPAPKAVRHGTRGFEPGAAARAGVRSEDAGSKLTNTLGIKPEDLRGAKKDLKSEERLREVFRRSDDPKSVEIRERLRKIFKRPEKEFVFHGWEIELTQPHVKGMRLIMTSNHPRELIGNVASQVSEFVFTKCMEVIDRQGRHIWYFLVKPAAASLENLDDTAQVLEVGGEESKPAPEPAQEDEGAAAADRRISEIHEAVKEYTTNFKDASWNPLEDEIIFDEHIAILFSSRGRYHLITDGEWEEARMRLQEHLDACGQDVRLVEAVYGFAGDRSVVLPSGEEMAVIVRPVGKMAVKSGQKGEGVSSQTIPMIPRDVLEAAGAVKPREDPEAAATREFALSLLREAVQFSFLDAPADDVMEKTELLQELPGSVAKINLEEPYAGRRYLVAKTSGGRDYAIFSLDCDPKQVSQYIPDMPDAIIFTNKSWPGISFLLIEQKSLSPRLIEMLIDKYPVPSSP